MEGHFLHSSTFEYLAPTSEQIATMAKVREAFATCAGQVILNVPEGPDRTYLLRKLRECGMWANVAITRNADGSPIVVTPVEFDPREQWFRITLEAVYRGGSKWISSTARVLIWSETRKAWWRNRGCSYTKVRDEADVFWFSEALQRIVSNTFYMDDEISLDVLLDKNLKRPLV
jgi:hypothetical protein